jgi:hypothetical protein
MLNSLVFLQTVTLLTMSTMEITVLWTATAAMFLTVQTACYLWPPDFKVMQREGCMP